MHVNGEYKLSNTYSKELRTGVFHFKEEARLKEHIRHCAAQAANAKLVHVP
jgi:hypothetical protein